MSKIRSKETQIERIVYRYLRKQGIYFQKHYKKAPGFPDVALPRKKIAIFIDGDFWHGNPAYYRIPKTNAEYWERKIQRNIARDEEVVAELVRLGWRVIRFWESNLKDEYAVAARISFELGRSS